MNLHYLDDISPNNAIILDHILIINKILKYKGDI